MIDQNYWILKKLNNKTNVTFDLISLTYIGKIINNYD